RFSRDWSSDVCSSDLQARMDGDRLETTGRRLYGVVGGHIGTHPGCTLSGRNVTDAGHLVGLFFFRGPDSHRPRGPRVHPRKPTEIGRASCRDRAATWG